jgi:hypothetical protein
MVEPHVVFAFCKLRERLRVGVHDHGVGTGALDYGEAVAVFILFRAGEWRRLLREL